MIKYRSNARDTILLIVVGYYLPVILIWKDIIPSSLRFYILELMTVIFIFYSWRKKKSLRELGIRKDTLKGSLVWNVLVTFVITSIMLAMYFSGNIRPQTAQLGVGFYIFYVFLSSPSQEFIYRGLLFNELNNLNNNALFQIIFSAITYSFLHIIYHDLITMLASLFMGVLWGITYYYRPNLIGVSISHSILGAISIVIGLI